MVLTHPMVFRSELMGSHYSEIGLLAVVMDRFAQGAVIHMAIHD